MTNPTIMMFSDSIDNIENDDDNNGGNITNNNNNMMIDCESSR
jgi:hypothetical protein